MQCVEFVQSFVFEMCSITVTVIRSFVAVPYSFTVQNYFHASNLIVSRQEVDSFLSSLQFIG